MKIKSILWTELKESESRAKSKIKCGESTQRSNGVSKSHSQIIVFIKFRSHPVVSHIQVRVELISQSGETESHSKSKSE